jgi:hypothetical protein
MPYSNAWTNNHPLGSAAPSGIDDAARRLRLDIQERMDSIVDDWTADPVVLTVSGIGGQTGVEVFFSHNLIEVEDDTNSWTRTDLYLETDNNTGDRYYMPLMLPVNAELQQIDILIDKHNSPQVDITLQYVEFDVTPAALTVGSTQNYTTVGIQKYTFASSMAHTIVTDRMYQLKFELVGAGAARIYGVKCTIDLAGLTAYV